MTRLLGSACLLLAVALSATPAHAGTINGSLSITGGFTPTGGVGLADATGIDFDQNSFGVAQANGEFAGITGPGAIQNFSFAPFFGPVDPLWTVGGFAMTLEAVTVEFQNSLFLALSGTGTMTGTGFDPTVGKFALTANGFGGTFSWSASSAGGGAVALDEPFSGELILLVAGLVGLALNVRGQALCLDGIS